MSKYIILNKDNGEQTELSATTKESAVIELLGILNLELIIRPLTGKQIKEYKVTCKSCVQVFRTTDRRYFSCPDCRKGGQIKEYEVTCIWCTREFTTTDKRFKRCSYCVSRNFNMNIPGMKQHCRECEKLECDELKCEHYPYSK